MRGLSINSFYDGFSQRCVFIEKYVSTKKIKRGNLSNLRKYKEGTRRFLENKA